MKCNWKILCFLSLCCNSAHAACDLSGWGFSSYRKLEIGHITIDNGSEPAGATMLPGDSGDTADKYNISSVWKNSGTGDIHASGIGAGGSIKYTYPTSYYTGADTECQISIKPLSDLVDVDITDNTYQYYYQKQFAFGGEIRIPAGCPEGEYAGDITIEAHIIDPVRCPEGGVVRSVFPSRLEIGTVKDGGTTLSVFSRDDLNFGALFASKDSGTVKITASSDTPQYLNVRSVNVGDTQRGVIEVKGTAGTQYSITLPSAIVLYNAANAELSVTDMHTSYTNKTLDSSGTDLLYVGGTLNVPARPQPGDYSGQYTVQISY